MTNTAAEFAQALETHAPRYDVQLSPATVVRLTSYFELVGAWNARLHLVAPCAPAEFATRHVLESLVALHFISMNAHVVDVGSGAGLPIIPCLIVRPDMRATLIEAAQKKAVFLREALSRLCLRARAQVLAERFEQTDAPAADFLTCRALERFTEMLSSIIAWSPPASTLLLFGGPVLRDKLEQLALTYDAVQLPATERRFLFRITRASNKTG
jgi:16S rRNA (guanine527-N7)-methyltransferase